MVNLMNMILKEYKSEFFAVLLKGSKGKGKKSDFWSDTDYLIIMDENKCVDKRIGQLVKNNFNVIGEELHEESSDMVYRWIILDEGQVKMLDLQIVDYNYYLQEKVINIGELDVVYLKSNEVIIYGEGNTGQQEYIVFLSKEHINDLWFRFFETTKKICRKDHLIGLHLLLDLVKEYLVLDMMERDAKKQTHIHRHGDFEQLPPEISVNQVHTSDTIQLLSYIDRLSKTMDQRLINMDGDYISRYQIFHEYIVESKKRV